MHYERQYTPETLDRATLDGAGGTRLLEFGAGWCPICSAAQPRIEAAVTASPVQATHVKIEDGPGRPLGRSFRVKLWPTLVLMHDGRELGRVVRPESDAQVASLLALADGAA